MNFVYLLVWIGSRTIFKCYFRWHVFNPQRVPASGPVVLAVNHSSFLDRCWSGPGSTAA